MIAKMSSSYSKVLWGPLYILGKLKSNVERIEEQINLMKGVNSVQVGIEDAASSGNLGSVYIYSNPHFSFFLMCFPSVHFLCVSSFLMYPIRSIINVLTSFLI